MKNTVTQKQVDALIDNAKRVEVSKLGDKTCVVYVVLESGFEMMESASCVDPANYDEKIGKEICLDRIKNKLWELEGYKLQCELSVK
jgi:hypothetical protein